MRWNLSGELCSGAAVDSTDLDSGDYNPGIKCDCSFPNSTCHITRLWASDVEFTGRIPDFIGNWTLLKTLRFEGNSFEGSIPPSFSRLTALEELRISGLSNGTLDFIRDMKSLGVLFLGNNSLNGTLPDVKSSNLSNINLVVNNFTLDDIGSNGLPSDLICLQRNFPCGRGSPSYSDFGINCGGPRITSSNQLLHERDNETVRAASYYVTSERRWGVSNVGQSEDPTFTVSSSRQFTNTLDSELFQTARISAGSLRYYGLGLQNGNYTVTLQFAELQIEDPSTWRSTGRRVFDIYLMLRLILQFLHREFEANFLPTVSNTPPSTKKKNKTGLIVGILVPIAVLSFLSLLALYIFRQRRKKQDTSDNYEEFLGIDAKPYTFSYGDLRDATDDFSPANKLGEGGFGPVYKGTLEDARVIAVKQLSVASHQGKAQFIAEIATISACDISVDFLELLTTLYVFCSGYLAPEYAMRGHLTEKADVFGFGVVALEMISGRPNSDSTLEAEKIYLLEWVNHSFSLLFLTNFAWNLHEADNEVELVDKELYEFDENEVKRVTRIALLCTQTSPMQRPPMSRVVAMLSGDIEASGTNYMPITSHSTLSPSTPDNASKSMLHNMIEDGRFLGNNSLNGTLPDVKSATLRNINLVVNNFTLGDSGNSSLPSGLNCLQRNFPCARGSPRYSELFQTARLSGSSLRYYGLGLENGNYTVTLQFAELQIEDGLTWKSTGRRVFDIYLQGTLDDGRVIAVKHLSVASHQGKAQFIAEIATVSAVQHRNLVKLYGCCIEGDKRLLVYEYLENKSLDQALFGYNSWYLAPEYAMRGYLTEKADVFGFGVIALEIISGRSNSDSTLEDEKIYLLEWAWNLHEANSEVELVDEELSDFDENEVKRVMKIALLCTQTSPTQRPPMSRVVSMLSRDIEASGVITRPGYLSGFNFKDSTTFKSALRTLGTNSMSSTSHSNVSPSSPSNDSNPMLHNMIGNVR
ncbi:hypothetical protein L1987_85250 [Smallanthus sonchifolius]|uniref:Uncharacterized protein n=1 Tax=Smallanthus sonchifolius TaxID=185202 RepID=A0ACB8XWN4_9ASTR|nr:hypothetical protein L1987_85250 [Smallanthus sonchifolius]